MNHIFPFLIALLASQAAYAEVTRHPLLNDNPFPIARAVEVAPDTALIYHSGIVPRPQDRDAERFSRAYYGDTETQALSVFQRFEESLSDLGVGFGDVVKMTVFLVGDPENDGRMDFAGFMRAYSKHFATDDQPNKPARSVVQISGLAGGPNMLVEIEMVIAKPAE